MRVAPAPGPEASGLGKSQAEVQRPGCHQHPLFQTASSKSGPTHLLCLLPLKSPREAAHPICPTTKAVTSPPGPLPQSDTSPCCRSSYASPKAPRGPNPSP